MSKTIATATATKDDELLEDRGDISWTDLNSLLEYADQIVIHEVEDSDEVEDSKRRYVDEWEGKVVLADTDAEAENNNNDTDDNADTEATMGESGVCLNANCEDDATRAVICQMGPVKHYCDEHGDVSHSGAGGIEEVVSL